MKVLVCIYHPVDLFPPTINAVNVLANECEEVFLISNKHAFEDPAISSHVKQHYVLENVQRPRSSISGMKRFMQFTNAVRNQMNRQKYDVVLIYDPHALLSFVVSRKLFSKSPHITWYHNHDVLELKGQRRFSAGWFAIKAERKYFSQLDIFSLPANDRKKCFPMERLKGKYFFIPNFPSVTFMNRFQRSKKNPEHIRLIFQGRISKGHGIEEVINILNTSINGKQLQLFLKGFVETDYATALKKQAEKLGVEDRLHFFGVSPYDEVPKLTATCQIGLSIHRNDDIMSKTLGTASNKTYEYAALGLPVIVLDTPHFREHLGKYSWTHFTDCSQSSLQACIKAIDENYLAFSEGAHKDFKEQLNFELNFQSAVSYCKEKLSEKI